MPMVQYERSFLGEMNDLIQQNLRVSNGIAQHYIETRAQADVTHMKLQLEKDTDEFLLSLDKGGADDPDALDKKLEDFLQRRNDQIATKNSPYYARNALTAGLMKDVLDSNINAITAKVEAKKWQLAAADGKHKLSEDLQYIMNRGISEGEEVTDENGDTQKIGAYSYTDRNEEAISRIYESEQAGYITKPEAEQLAENIYKENLQAQWQTVYYEYAKTHPDATESEVDAKAKEAMKNGSFSYMDTEGKNQTYNIERVDGLQYRDYWQERQEKAVYDEQKRAYEEALSSGKIIAAPIAPQSREQRRATYTKETKNLTAEQKAKYDRTHSKFLDLFESIDQEAVYSNASKQARSVIVQQQRENNEKAMQENEKLTTRYWELTSSAIDGKASNSQLSGLLTVVKARIEELEKVSNFDMNAGDKRARIRELYEKYNGIKEAIAYNEEKARHPRTSGSGGEKEQNMSFRTYASQMYDFYKAEVLNGRMTAENAQQAYKDLLNDAITYNRGYKGETFEDNKIAFSQMTNEQKDDIREITESEFIGKFADDAISLIAKSDKSASVKAKYDRLVSDIKAHPESYSDDALAKLAGGLNSFYFTQFNNPDFDTEGGLKALDDMYAQCFLESVKNKQALMPYRDKDGNVNAEGFSYSHLGDSSPNEKEIAGSIDALNAMDNAVYRDPRTGKDIHVNERTKEAVIDSCEVLKSQIAADLGIDRSQFETEPTFKRDKKGDPTYQPQFHTTDGNVYEIRSTEDKKGYEIYDVTGGKEKKLDAKHVKLSDATKKKQKQAKQQTKEENAKSKEAELKRDPLLTNISKDLQRILDNEGITYYQWNNKTDDEKKKIEAKYGL